LYFIYSIFTLKGTLAHDAIHVLN